MTIVSTAEEAIDDICKMLQDAWENDPRTLNIPIVWDNVAHAHKGTPDYFGNPEIWLEVIVAHEDSRKTSLGGPGASKYEHSGGIVAKLHMPRGKGTVAGLSLISVVVDTFQGNRSPNGVRFRQVRFANVGNEGAYNVTAMTGEFFYDQYR